MTQLQKKALHEVEITAPCKLAQINRSTFYEHYEDVDALASTFAEKNRKDDNSHRSFKPWPESLHRSLQRLRQN